MIDTEKASKFTFNGDYKDLDQVAQYLPEFTAIRDEIAAAGARPYNDSFKGRIPGIANTEKRGENLGTHEDTAIYLLQRLYRANETAARVDAAIADGYEPIDRVDSPTRFESIIVYGNETWVEFREARLIPEQNPRQAEVTGNLAAILPKGKRTHGHRIEGKKVLARKGSR